PEQVSPALLDLARIRYEIRRGQRPPPNTVASFGSIHVAERPQWQDAPEIRIEGTGNAEIVDDDRDADALRVRVRGTTAPTRVVFGVAGFPRFILEGPQGEITWYEAPVVPGGGRTATQTERRQGALRGGRAHGDDGTEPTLIAADLGDGEY